MYVRTRFLSIAAASLFSLFLIGCQDSVEVAAPVPVPASQTASDVPAYVPVGTVMVTTIDDFEPTADEANFEIAAQLYDRLPFADETMPEDSAAFFEQQSTLAEQCDDQRKPVLDTLHPVNDCLLSEDGYPVYLVKCNLQTRMCINLETHEPAGLVEDIATELTFVRNTDVLREEFICDHVCIDGDNNLVGAVAPDMQDWIESKQ